MSNKLSQAVTAGTLASRPAAGSSPSGLEGALYFATDASSGGVTGVWYQSDGATWTARGHTLSVTEAMQSLADNTTGNVSTSRHGYAPRAPNDATKYLDGTGAYSVPAGGGGGSLTDHTHAATGSGSNGGGATLQPGTLDIPSATSPAQTAEGRAVWDSDDDVLTVGDGSSRKTFGYLGTTTPTNSGTAAAGTSKETSRADHDHGITGAAPTTIRGRVNADGTIAAGTGFTVNKSATGTYDITFSSAFSTAPAVVVSPYAAAGSGFSFVFSVPTTTTVTILTTSFGGSNTDKAFSFIAMAP